MACDNNRRLMRRVASYVLNQRVARGWCQVDLAAAADVSKRTIQRIEVAEEVSLTSLFAISAAFGQSLPVLLQAAEDA